MGGKPKTIYADSEGALFNKEIKDYLEENNIKLIIEKIKQ